MTTRHPRHALALLTVAALATACGQAPEPIAERPLPTFEQIRDALEATAPARVVIPPRTPPPPPAGGGPIICAPHPCGFDGGARP